MVIEKEKLFDYTSSAPRILRVKYQCELSPDDYRTSILINALLLTYLVHFRIF